MRIAYHRKPSLRRYRGSLHGQGRFEQIDVCAAEVSGKDSVQFGLACVFSDAKDLIRAIVWSFCTSLPARPGGSP